MLIDDACGNVSCPHINPPKAIINRGKFSSATPAIQTSESRRLEGLLLTGVEGTRSGPQAPERAPATLSPGRALCGCKRHGYHKPPFPGSGDDCARLPGLRPLRGLRTGDNSKPSSLRLSFNVILNQTALNRPHLQFGSHFGSSATPST